jgi:hypothetical protein
MSAGFHARDTHGIYLLSGVGIGYTIGLKSLVLDREGGSDSDPVSSDEPVRGTLPYYAIWWEGKTVLKKAGRKFSQKP